MQRRHGWLGLLIHGINGVLGQSGTALSEAVEATHVRGRVRLCISITCITSDLSLVRRVS